MTWRLSRRGFLGAAGGLTAAATGIGAAAVAGEPGRQASAGPALAVAEPFYGVHQGGVATTPQLHTLFAALDVTTGRRADVVDLLRRWTGVAAQLTEGAAGSAASPGRGDSGETLGLGPARLTVNFGLGPSLFTMEGADRFGLASVQPWQLVDLPAFPGDDLTPGSTGGDLSVHACADDPQVAFHAVRTLLREADPVARVRWSQPGYNETGVTHGTPRNLLGFKDGTTNPRTAAALDAAVWVGGEGPDWMRGGSYMVVRRISLDLTAWDGLSVEAQQRVIGRHKDSGAPLTGTREADPLDLQARSAGGDPVIPSDAHVRLASPAQNWDSVILRRGYAYANPAPAAPAAAGPAGSDPLDAGLLFFSYQRNPRLSFVPIYRTLSAHDALRKFTSHTASAIFALPGGAVGPHRWVGDTLFV